VLTNVAPCMMALLIAQNPASSSAIHPLTGRWVADIRASRFNGAVAVKSTPLDFRVDANAVVITSRTIDVNDRVVASVQGE